MDSLGVGIRALRVGETLIACRPTRTAMTADDRRRLSAGVDLLSNVLAAAVFVDTGKVESLEPASLEEARHAGRVIHAWHTVRTLPQIRDYLNRLANTLRSVQEGKPPSQQAYGETEDFFIKLGEALVSETINEPPSWPSSSANGDAEDGEADGELGLIVSSPTPVREGEFFGRHR